MKKPLIFITNDDGYTSKGFRRIIEVARRFGQVIAIAPEVSQSGKAHAITLSTPLYLTLRQKSDDVTVYSCSGTPVDCVKMAYDYLFDDLRPALSISGINHGSNAAINILYSGTMGAAIEASFYGAPSIGLSLDDHDLDADFDATAEFAERIIPEILAADIREPLCLNINVPVARPEEIRGWKICRQTRGYWKEEFERSADANGTETFVLAGKFCNFEPEADDTDEWALLHNYIAIVPVKIDLTDYDAIGPLHDIVK